MIYILLNISKYAINPNNIPKKIYSLNSPSVNSKIEYISISPLSIQNIMSCKFVIIFENLKLFRSILKVSNNIPINKPFNMKIKKV